MPIMERVDLHWDAFPDWPQLRAKYQHTQGYLTSDHHRTPTMLQSTTGSRSLVSKVTTVSGLLSQACILYDVHIYDEVMTNYAPFLGAAAEELDSLNEDAQYQWEVTVRFLHLINAFECSGHPVPPEVQERVPTWLRHVVAGSRKQDEFAQESVGTLCLALGAPFLFTQALRGALPQTFVPGRRFKMNSTGFLRYLACAQMHGARLEEVQPAWMNMLACFPVHRATDTFEWEELLCCGRAVYAQIGGAAVGTVAQTIHQIVTADAPPCGCLEDTP